MADEEIVEMEMDDVEEKPSAPQRRVPRRARSTDGGISPPRRTPGRSQSSDGSAPTRRTPARTKSSDGSAASSSGALRRMRTEASGGMGPPTRRSKTMTMPPMRVGRLPESKNEDDSDGEEVAMEEDDAPVKPTPRRAPPRRTKSSDGGLAARMMPRRVKSTDGSEMSPTRSAPKRNISGFGRATPRRVKSSDGSAGSTLLGMRKGRKKEKAGMVANSMNIFGSDMVSEAKVIEDIQKAAANQEVTKLELEDFFTAERDPPDGVPLALKDLLEGDDRPWESVAFVDDIMDGSMYSTFKARKKEFLKNFGNVCATRLIPVSYKAKITLSSGSLSLEQMVEVLQKFKADKSITSLTIKSEHVDEIIITSLTDLFTADKRKWESVTLQLSGGGPEQPGSPEHAAWCQRMQSATEQMQRTCKDRGINLG